MFIYTPQDWNGVCVVADSRLKKDVQIQEAEGGSPVLEEHGFFSFAVGKREWARTMRIALYDYKEDLSALTPENATRLEATPEGKKRENLRKTLVANQRRDKKQDMLRALQEAKPRAVLVIQTLAAKSQNKEEEPNASSNGTMCWEAFNAPDSFASMQGTCWDSHGFNFGSVIALPNPLNYEHVFGHLVRRWTRMALELSAGRIAPLTCTRKYSVPYSGMITGLTDLQSSANRGVPIAVDIESYSPKNLITAVGLSDGMVAVSVPWEPFVPYGRDYIEPGFAADELYGTAVKAILATDAPKVFHNYSYDVPFLAEKGVPVRGKIHDTMALHKVAYAQFRRGLQAAATQEFCIRPWKSVWNPKVKGLTRDDADYWILDPLALRDYNCDDAFVTWKLAEALAWKCGVKL